MTIKYLVKRVLLLILVLWTAATVNFFVPKLSPRNPILEFPDGGRSGRSAGTLPPM